MTINLADVKVGDKIPCKYKASSGKVGIFSELGTCTSPTIPASGSESPDGLFNFIKASSSLFIADRVIQHSISWDTLDTGNMIKGIINPCNWTATSYSGSLNYNPSKKAYSVSSVIFNNELYFTWYEDNKIRVKKFNGSEWVTADNNTPLNYDVSRVATAPSIIVFNNELYVSWQENNAGYNQIRVKKFDGVNWVTADNNTSLNYNTSKNAIDSKLIVFNNELYIIFHEDTKLRAKKLSGNSWITVDNNAPLNYDASRAAMNSSPLVFNNELYITFQETNGANYQIRIKKFNGANWITADNNTPLNYDASKTTGLPSLIVFNNELYITFQETNEAMIVQIRVKKFNGTDWITADNNTPLNYNTSKIATYPFIIVFNDELYVAFTEEYKIRVKKFDGASWITADNDPSNSSSAPLLCKFNNELYMAWLENDQVRVKKLNKDIWVPAGDGATPLNYDSTTYASYQSSIVFNNELYVFWPESTPINQIRVKKFNGIEWVTADKNTPLNYDVSKNAMSPSPTIFNNELYVIFQENNGTAMQIRAKKFNGANWVTADNNTPLGYNTSTGGNYPVVAIFNNELYVTWYEVVAGYNQIRVKKFNGASWVTADNNTSLNYNTSKNALGQKLIVFKNEIYVFWHEQDGSGAFQIRAKKLNGANWVTADNNTSLNYSPSMSANYAFPIVFNDELYVAWYEKSGTINQIRVKKFNGENWVTADNNTSLNYDTSKYAIDTSLCVFNNELYIAWTEIITTGSNYQTRVKKFNGSEWVTADNNTSLSYDIYKESKRPLLCEFNNELYITWTENNTAGANLVRIKKLEIIVQGTIRSLSGGNAYADANGNSVDIDQGKGGSPTKNEWDKYIVNSALGGTIIAGDNNIWNWENVSTWTQETPISSISTPENKVIRGKTTSNTFDYINSNTVSPDIGFRPVILLELAVSYNYLILDGNSLKTIQDNLLTEVCKITDSDGAIENAFLDYGVEPGSITPEILSQIQNEQFKILVYEH